MILLIILLTLGTLLFVGLDLFLPNWLTVLVGLPSFLILTIFIIRLFNRKTDIQQLINNLSPELHAQLNQAYKIIDSDKFSSSFLPSGIAVIANEGLVIVLPKSLTSYPYKDIQGIHYSRNFYSLARYNIYLRNGQIIEILLHSRLSQNTDPATNIEDTLDMTQNFELSLAQKNVIFEDDSNLGKRVRSKSIAMIIAFSVSLIIFALIISVVLVATGHKPG